MGAAPEFRRLAPAFGPFGPRFTSQRFRARRHRLRQRDRRPMVTVSAARGRHHVALQPAASAARSVLASGRRIGRTWRTIQPGAEQSGHAAAGHTTLVQGTHFGRGRSAHTGRLAFLRRICLRGRRRLVEADTGERPARGRAIRTRRALSNLLLGSPACFARACANRPWAPDFGEPPAPPGELPTQSASTGTNK